MDEKIYYLAHPWKVNPTLSFQNAVKWTRKLREMGKVVFSPILHTHPYWDRLCFNGSYEIACSNEDCETGCHSVNSLEDFEKSNKCGVCGSEVEIISSPKDLTINEYLDSEDWLAWDLALMGKMMAGDGEKYPFCLTCGGTADSPNEHCSKPDIEWRVKYDSNLVLLLSRTAYKDTSKSFIKSCALWMKGDLPTTIWKSLWLSQGCRQEYEKAKSKHVRVLEAESFMEEKEVEL